MAKLAEQTGPPPASDEGLRRLETAWASPRGFAGLSAVNHKVVGTRFIVTAFFFFLIGGIQALLIRLQLFVPENTLVGPDTFNELFTMHGTTMMFLFALPMVEGIGMYLLPLMVGTRDLPFPRLNAFGYFTYLFGGIILYSSFITGNVPDGGWFAYPPLTGPEFRPGLNLDYWLLGVTFVEISAVAGAIELVVVILKRRAPGMSINRMPVFAWSILVTGLTILISFPPLIIGSLMLEVERKLAFSFFSATGGGDPLLWQHLFWWFGHPDVYILFLPAVGLAATVVPVMARVPLAGYSLVVASIVGTGLLSFGVWIHHMFTTGIPLLASSFAGAASMLFAITSGIQVFALIATVWQGKVRWATPMLYMVGFLLIFVLGGITGIMLAAPAFDWQVHDTYFVVAHFHYVLIGGMLFPFLGALYFWFPKFTGRMLDERTGRLGFWLSFLGFNLTFLPQHWLGFEGMPRRVYTYPAGLGWELNNFLSSLGALMLATSILVIMFGIVRSLRTGRLVSANPWGADTLEWGADSPPAAYNFRSIPVVASLNPLWDPEGMDPGNHPEYQGPVVTDPVDANRREVVTTTLVDARPETIETLPGPSFAPLVMAIGLTLVLIAALYDLALVAVVGGLVALAAGINWMWPPPEYRQ